MSDEEHPNERLVTAPEDTPAWRRGITRRDMLAGSTMLAGLLAYTSDDPTNPTLPNSGIARASHNPDEPLIVLGPESDPVGYIFQDTDGGIILQDATSGNHFWYNQAEGRWETDAELDVPALTTEDLLNADIGDSVDYSDPLWIVETGSFLFITHFESLDGWNQVTSGSGSVDLGEFQVELSTGGTSSSEAQIRKRPAAEIASVDFDDPYQIRIGLNIIDSASDRTDYYTAGRPSDGTQGFGFKVAGGDLEGVTHDGTTENTATLVSGLSTGLKDLRAVLNPGSQVTFYVDETQQGTSQSNLPSGSSEARHTQFTVENSTTADRRARISEFRTVVRA